MTGIGPEGKELHPLYIHKGLPGLIVLLELLIVIKSIRTYLVSI